MSPGTTYDRVYRLLKQQLLERTFRPGERLDPAQLGEALHSSVTPVRSALHTLIGERLVEARTSDGFHLPSVDGPGLRDLYRWNSEVLQLALRVGAKPEPDLDPGALRFADPPATTIAAIFAAIGQSSSNLEHRRAISSLNDRLHAVRLAEVQVLADLEEELAEFAILLDGHRQPLRRLVIRYHRRRVREADAIVRILYRNGDAI